MRRDAVAFVRGGVTVRQGASLLTLSPGTLKGWLARSGRGVLGPNPLGRPAYRSTEEVAHDLREMARAAGIKVSVRYIREKMPHVPRAVIERVVHDYKKDRRRQVKEDLLKLDWPEPGRVWVCDWTEPDSPVDGVYNQILVVRDLGAGLLLRAMPVRGKSSGIACSVMEHLFAVHGAPLVLKTDNGSEFMAGVFKRMIEEHGVVHLVSPAYYPPYNGAIEAGIGSLKGHALAEALKRGSSHLTCNDIEAGCLIANETSRPWGPKGPSPEEAWRQRTAIGGDERKRFIESLEKTYNQYGKLNELSEAQRKAGERRAIEKTLIDSGYLVVKRRRITPQVYEKNRTNLT